MKEAAGEANLTVVAIILIGVIAAVVTPIITTMMGSTASRTCCMDSGGRWVNNDCVDPGQGYQQCVREAGNRNNTH